MAFLNDVQDTKPNTTPQGTGGFLNSVVDTPQVVQTPTTQQQTVAPLEINTPQVTAKVQQNEEQSNNSVVGDIYNFGKNIGSTVVNDIVSAPSYLKSAYDNPITTSEGFLASGLQALGSITDLAQSVTRPLLSLESKGINKATSMLLSVLHGKNITFKGGTNLSKEYNLYNKGANILINNSLSNHPRTKEQRKAFVVGGLAGIIAQYAIGQSAVEKATVGAVKVIGEHLPIVARGVGALSRAEFLHKWTIGYISKGIKQFGAGFITSMILDHKDSMVKHAFETGGIFAGLTMVSYPIAEFFRPILKQVGEADIKSAGLRRLLQNKDVTEKPISNTLLFRNPNDSTQLLRVTAKGATVVDGSAKNLKALGIDGKGIARLDSIQIEAFKENPSPYNWLKDWSKKKLKIGDKIDFNEKYANATPGDVINTPTTPEIAPVTSSPVDLTKQAQDILSKGGTKSEAILQVADTVGVDQATKIVDNAVKSVSVAVTQATPKQQVKTTPQIDALQKKISEMDIQLGYTRDVVNSMPGKELRKYVSRETGMLPELGAKSTANKNKSTSVFARHGDTLSQEILGQTLSGGGDVTVAQEHVDAYIQEKDKLNALEEQYKQYKRELRDLRANKAIKRGNTPYDEYVASQTPQVKKSANKKPIESSVVQIVNAKTDTKSFKTIPSGELKDFIDKIDNTSHGIAGTQQSNGDIYHLTAKTPQSMIDNGFKFNGVAKLSDIPNQVKPIEPTAFTEARKLSKLIPETYKINTTERAKLRMEIANKLYGNGSKLKNSRADIVLGLPAGGKSSAIATPLSEKHGALIIDSDMAKELLPEYQNGIGANATHQESSDIAEFVHTLATKNKDNIILPLVGRNYIKIRDIIDELHSKGYEVHLHYNHVSVKTAKERAISRFNQTGRFVDTHYIESLGLQPSETYDKLTTYGQETKGIQKDVGTQSKAPKQVSTSNNRGRSQGLLELGKIASYSAYSNEVPRGNKPIFLKDKSSARPITPTTTVHKNLFTQDEINNLNRNSHFNVNWNEDYNNTISNIKEKVNLQNGIPSELKSEWDTFIKNYTDLYKRGLEIRADNPSPAVVGRANFNNTRRDKMFAREGVLYTKKDKLISNFEKKVNQFNRKKETSRKLSLTEEQKMQEKIAKNSGMIRDLSPERDAFFIKKLQRENRSLEKKIHNIQVISKLKDQAQTTKILRGTKGKTAEDIMKVYPNIKLTKDVPAKDVYGNKVVIPEGEKLTPYEMKDGKILLQDGETYLVSKNQFANIKGNTISGEAKPFAPELKSTAESILKKTEIKDTTKFSEYTLPGGKDYKEILIKVPEIKLYSHEKEINSFFNRIGGVKNVKDMTPIEKIDYQTILDRRNKEISNNISEPFKSPHWNESNVLAHIRVDQRTYKDKPVTFMEELQSDWAKSLRDKGEQVGEPYTVENIGAGGRILNTENKTVGAVPNNPLLKNWQEWSIKRALQDAVTNKSDYFAWINGAQTSARYDLATHLDNVTWFNESGGKTVKLKATGGMVAMEFQVNEKGIIHQVEDSAQPDWKGKKLDEVIGKGLADKILAKDTGTLSGSGLSFGGEWAHNLYDKQVPNIVKKLTGSDVIKMDMGLPISTSVKPIFKGNSFFDKTFDKYDTPMKAEDLKVGRDVFVGKSSEVSTQENYVITDVIGGGEFKAVQKDIYTKAKEDGTWNRISRLDTISDFLKRNTRTFYISNPTTVQQGIKLTPDVIAKIKGESPKIETSGKQFVANDTTVKLPELPQPSKPILGVAFPGADYVATFIEKDVIDNFKNQKEALKSIWKVVKSPFTEESDITQKASAVASSHIMTVEQYASASWKVAEASRNWWAKIPSETHINIIDNIDHGKLAPKYFMEGYFAGTPKEVADTYSELARAYKIRMDKSFKFESNAGVKVHYTIHYFPHIWDNVEQAKIVFERYSRSMSKGRFTKVRFITFLKVGYKHGLKLKTTNLEELITMREIDGFRISEYIRLMDEFEAIGLALPQDTKGHYTWKLVETPDGRQLLMSPEASKILERSIFAKNLWSQKGFFPSVFRNLMRAKSIYVPLKLAVSLFHLVHITTIATSDARKMVYRKILNGHLNGIEAVKELGKATFFVTQYKAIKQYGIGTIGLKGLWQADISRWWDTPMNKLEPYQREVVQYLIDGGGTPKMSEEFAVRSKDAMRKAVHEGNYLGATIRGIPKAIESIQKPIFESYIPALKVYSYMQSVYELLKTKPELLTDNVSRRIAFRELWKSVDNRFGQMNYKTLFWQPAVKQYMQVTFLSLGWNLGFSREYGGGEIVDFPKLMLKGTMGRATKEDITDKILFSWDYIGQAVIIGGLITYALTGDRPKTIEDFFFPRVGGTNPDGSPARVNTPFFTREYFGAENHYRKQGLVVGATSLLEDKMNPVLSSMSEILKNKDFYGYQIRDTNSPVMVQSAQFMDYMLKNALVPISVSGAIRASTVTGKKGVALSFLGFNPAPKYIAENEIESKIYSILDKRTGGVKPLSQRVMSDSKSNIRNLYLEGKIKEARVALKNAIKAGYISPRGRAGFIRNLDIPSDVRAFGALSQFPTDQQYLLSIMTEKQLQRYAGHASGKIKKIISTLSPTAKKFVSDLKRGKIRLARFKRGKQI